MAGPQGCRGLSDTDQSFVQTYGRCSGQAASCVEQATEGVRSLQAGPTGSDADRKTMILRQKISRRPLGSMRPAFAAGCCRSSNGAELPRASAVFLPDLAATRATVERRLKRGGHLVKMLHCGRLPYRQTRTMVSEFLPKPLGPMVSKGFFAVAQCANVSSCRHPVTGVEATKPARMQGTPAAPIRSRCQTSLHPLTMAGFFRGRRRGEFEGCRSRRLPRQKKRPWHPGGDRHTTLCAKYERVRITT